MIQKVELATFDSLINLSNVLQNHFWLEHMKILLELAELNSLNLPTCPELFLLSTDVAKSQNQY